MTYQGLRITPAVATDDVVAHAVALSAGGLPVFPVWGVRQVAGGWRCTCDRDPDGHKPGKHPATAHGHHDAALVDESRARGMFPGDKNLALPTGDGLVVLDFDPRNGGHETYDDWESWTGGVSLPRTLTLETGSGGLHLYYLVPAGARVVSRTLALPGLDVQSDGKYVVGPGSRHVDGGLYRWRDPGVPVAPLSAELLGWLMTRRGGGGGTGAETPDDFDKARGFVAGQRDAYANARAFELRKRGLTADQIRAVMYPEWERADQPEGDFLPWAVVEEKIDRVCETVTPDATIDADVQARWLGSLRRPTTQTPSTPAAVGVEAPLEGDIIQTDFEHLSEMGNGARYARLLRDHVRYVPEESRWYCWDGSVLAPDRMDRSLELTKLVIADVRFQAEVEADHNLQQAAVQWALRSESLGNRKATRASGALVEGMSVAVDDLDRDPELLVVENGTLDLRTGRLRESRIADLCTRRAAVVFDADAECPKWLEHVEMVTAGDADLAAYLRRACGYTLTGLVSEQKFFFLFGNGQNGKNVFTETLRDLLGDYGVTAAPGLLTDSDGHPTALADLRGARMVLSDETEERRALNDARVKQLTGSTRIKARYMGKDFFEYDSTMKLWVLGNSKPVIRDTSEGMWRRMQLVPFTAQIPEGRRILRYEERLRAEWPGILNWCLRGLREWRERVNDETESARRDIGQPARVAEAVREYRAEEDSLGVYLTERTCADAAGSVPTSALYADYQLWMHLQGYGREDVLNSVHFGRALSSRGLERGQINIVNAEGRKSTARVYRGICLVGG